MVLLAVDLNARKGLECVELIKGEGGQASFVQANIANRDAIEEAVGVAA